MSRIVRMPGMRRASRALTIGASVVALGGLLAAGPAASAQPDTARSSTARPGASQPALIAPAAHLGSQRACAAAPAGHLSCFVIFHPQRAVNAALAAGHKTTPHGWSPKTLERAYRLPVSRNSHQTVGISIAYRTPHLADYLKIYREHYGLPPCTRRSGCLRIVNQNGKTSPAPPNGTGSGWDVEVTLDVSMVSAACPHCHILVVEANSTSNADLGKTDNTAARMGAEVISNSYGERENGYAQSFAKDYRHPGHKIVVSAGDGGFDAANFPANMSSVTAVGGTQLARAHNRRGFTERVWNQPALFAAGSSGCSAYVRKPSWQHDKHCPGRTVADISAIASNIPIYNAAWGGWLTVSGTSVASPFVAGIYGLAGNARSATTRDLYQHPKDFFDITKGNNLLFGTAKATCGNDYLCEAKPHYDAPTGLGTPNGISGF